jgi:hypothetical protein
LSFLKAFLASACGWRSAPSLLEKMGNTGERRGVMLEFEDASPGRFAQLVADAPDWVEWIN